MEQKVSFEITIINILSHFYSDIVRDGHSIISCLKSIDWNGEKGFITGEEVSHIKPFEERVCYYDMNSISNLVSSLMFTI